MSWMSGKEGAEYAGYSRDWLERRATPWSEIPVPYRVRYKWVRSAPNAKPVRRYWKAYIDALFVVPREQNLREFGPRFRRNPPE
jgi:hypothetical protein